MTPARRLLPPAVTAAAAAMSQLWDDMAEESRVCGGNPVIPDPSLFDLLAVAAVDAAHTAPAFRAGCRGLPDHYAFADAKADVQMLIDALDQLTGLIHRHGLEDILVDAYLPAVCALAAVDPTCRLST